MIDRQTSRPQRSALRPSTPALAWAVTSLAVTLLVTPTSASAQQASDASGMMSRSSTAIASRTDVAPVIDGDLGDAAWLNGSVLTDFIQREPSDGDPASERTEVRVIYDDDAIYIGVWAWDSQPDQIVPGDAIRDYEVTDADAVIMIFDTYKDEQNGFVFGTTPAGIEYDGQVAAGGAGGGRFFGGGGGGGGNRFQSGSGGGFNKNWDGSWTVASSTGDDGWFAEFRIPFSTLRYSSDQSTWGFNISRRIRRLNEESFWTAVPREFNLYRLEFAGDLAGIEPPFRRSGTVTPYVLGSTSRNYAAGDLEFGEQTEIGGEAKVQLTQSLTLDLTANTDFAQVEVDNQQVNLTRFSLLFPEKRLFFLENAGFFNVGGGGADLFFSRRIGISGGQPVPIKGGGRLSGRAAGLNVGLLHIETDGLAGAGGNAYSVARVAKELPSRSRVGGLVVNRDGALAGDYNRTYAVDANVGIGDQISVSSWASRTETPGLAGDEYAWDVTASLATRQWTGNATVREIGENFNPEVGFLPRSGHRYYQLFGMYYIRPSKIFREIRPHISYFTFRSRRTGVQNGFEETARWHIDSHWQWDSGMELHTGVNHITEGLFQPFTITGTGVTVPQGSYSGWEPLIVFFTDQSRMLSFNSRWAWGTFLSGSKRTSSVDGTLRLGARSSVTAAVQYNDVTLPEGDFTTTLASLRVGYFFTPRLYLQTLVQYSDQIDTFSANVRFGWLNTAGTGLFIVYNEIQGIQGLMGPQGRALTLKFTRQFGVLGN